MLRTSTRKALGRRIGFSPLATAQDRHTKLIDISDSFYNACLENLTDKANPMNRTKYNKDFLQQMYLSAVDCQLPEVLRSSVESKRFVEANSHVELRRRNVVYSEIVDGRRSVNRHPRLPHRDEGVPPLLLECARSEESG